jgi:hypothetical protein
MTSVWRSKLYLPHSLLCSSVDCAGRVTVWKGAAAAVENLKVMADARAEKWNAPRRWKMHRGETPRGLFTEKKVKAGANALACTRLTSTKCLGRFAVAHRVHHDEKEEQRKQQADYARTVDGSSL